MGWKSGRDRYGRVAASIHWVTALAVFGLLGSGLYMEDLDDPAAKIAILRVHAGMGITVLALTVLRILWWAVADRRPAMPDGMPRLQAVAAHAVHGLLYLVLIVMGTSGIAMIILSDAGAILVGAAPGPLPDFRDVLPRAPHGLGANLLMVLVGLHVAAAIYHQFVLRDGLIARMGFRS